MCRNLIDPFTLTGPALPYSLLESLDIMADSETNNIRSIPLLTSITEMFLYIHGQVIIRTGVELLSPRGGPEGQFCKHDDQSKENKPKEQGSEYLWSLIYLLLQTQGEKQQCLSFVYWTIFATLSIDLLACVPYSSMHVL